MIYQQIIPLCNQSNGSEGSCDSEDWSNDADNSALITIINYILKLQLQ